MTVQNTLSQIAMTPSEIKKYDELGTPYYRLDVMEMKNPICTRLTALRGIGPFQRYYGLKESILEIKSVDIVDDDGNTIKINRLMGRPEYRDLT